MGLPGSCERTGRCGHEKLVVRQFVKPKVEGFSASIRTSPTRG
jgi:hypothetical protein